MITFFSAFFSVDVVVAIFVSGKFLIYFTRKTNSFTLTIVKIFGATNTNYFYCVKDSQRNKIFIAACETLVYFELNQIHHHQWHWLKANGFHLNISFVSVLRKIQKWLVMKYGYLRKCINCKWNMWRHVFDVRKCSLFYLCLLPKANGKLQANISLLSWTKNKEKLRFIYIVVRIFAIFKIGISIWSRKRGVLTWHHARSKNDFQFFDYLY